MNKEQLKRLISSELPDQQRLAVLQWIRKNPKNQSLYARVKAQHIADTLKDVSEDERSSLFDDLTDRLTEKQHFRNFSRAAVILAIVGIGVLLAVVMGDFISHSVHPQTVVVNSENDFDRTIVLPDGSAVSLNIDSDFTYPAQFDQDIRVVTLVGEAHFDVKHDPSRPFVVKTRDFDVKVLGTTFNVKSYDNDRQTETTLFSGKVELAHNEEVPIVLAPSQKAIFDSKQERVSVLEVTEKTAVWRGNWCLPTLRCIRWYLIWNENTT